jgi:prepilin-type N-terminal cleavage/methylation domain-containing protein
LCPRYAGARRRHAWRTGFTLVEVIVVIVIIAILAAIGVPALTGYIEKAHEKELIAVANTSVKALQAWATEQYAYGNVGDEGLTDSDGNPVSFASYTDESRRFGSGGGVGGSIVTADYHPVSGQGVVNGVASDEGLFLPAATVSYGIEYYFVATLRYHFLDENGVEQDVETREYEIDAQYIYDDDYQITYAEVACGMPEIWYPGYQHGYLDEAITPASLREGYRVRKDTQQLISSGATLLKHEIWNDSYQGSVFYFWEGTYEGDLYYEVDIPEPSHWVRVVDLFAATDYESEGYVVTEVEFSGQNLLMHMKLTSPGGDFVVYANETYHYNADPTDSSSV